MDKSPRITVVGLGVSTWLGLTLEAERALLAAERVYCRFPYHPVQDELVRRGKILRNLAFLYGIKQIKYDEVYSLTRQILFRASLVYGAVAYAVPGSPFFFETSTLLMLEEATRWGVPVEVIDGVPCLGRILQKTAYDPWRCAGLQVIDASSPRLLGADIRPTTPVCFVQVAGLIDKDATATGRLSPYPPRGIRRLDRIAEMLKNLYPSEHKIFLIQAGGPPRYDQRTVSCTLAMLPDQDLPTEGETSILVPPRGSDA